MRDSGVHSRGFISETGFFINFKIKTINIIYGVPRISDY